MNRRRKLISVVALILVIVLAVGTIAGVLATTVHAASSSEIQSQINALQQQASDISQKKADLQSQIDEKEYEQADMIYQKSIIDQEMTITQEEIANTTAQIEQYERLIAEKEDELDEAKENEAVLYEQYKERLRAMEENGSVTYWSILFKASSFADLLDRIDMIQEIASADQKMMASLAAASEEIRVAREELENSQAAMEEQKALLTEQEATLAQQSAEAQVYIDQIASESAELQSVYDEYDAMEYAVIQKVAEAQDQYEKALAEEEAARLAAEEAERKAQEEAERQQQEQQNNNGSTGESTGGDTTQSPSAGSGQFIRPVSGGYISSPYGWRVHPVYGYEKFHYGVDYAVPAGTPIYATASGTVTIATYDASAGNYVSIAHADGFGSAYMHMTNYIVSVGDYVTQGQVIGYVGSTGCSTGAHLHFAMYYNGATVNPVDYVGG